jgi:cytochrome P450
MGLTAEESERLQHVQEVLHNASTPEELMQYTATGLELFGAVMHDRRANPSEDLIGSILAGEPDGQPLSDEQVLFYLWILFIGGLDSTVHALSASLLTLFHHPDQLVRLRDDPTVIDTGVEEMLRWTSVSQHLKRLATEDVVLAGQPIAAGEFVVVFDPSANRDERVYPDPYRFDVARAPGPLCTFGQGPHICPGLHFARLEMKIFFSELLRRFPDIHQAGPAVRSQAFSILLPPIQSLPVAFTPGPRIAGTSASTLAS